MQARAAGVYHLDWKIRQGQLGPFICLPFLDLARRGNRRRGCVGWSHLRQETRSSGTASQRPNRSEGRARANEKRRNPCAVAQEAETLREKRARQIKAEAELEAASLLRQAAETIMESPAGLELRRRRTKQHDDHLDAERTCGNGASDRRSIRREKRRRASMGRGGWLLGSG